MVKYLSGRQKLRPSDKLTEDRYQYLGLDQAEPNLADPATSPGVPSGLQYQLVAVTGYEGRRYWVPVGGSLQPGAITIFDEGTPVSSASSITQMNFVGAAVTAQVSLQNPSGHPGIAATVTVIPVNVGDSPPNTPTPNEGELWWESDTGDLYIYYNDGNSAQWVMANAGGRGLTGDKGEVGDKGQKGDTGLTGGSGQKGDKGEKGAPSTVAGPAGDKGQKGEIGAGQKGQKGEDGSDGAAGDKGQKGEIGVGTKGDKGDGTTGGAQVTISDTAPTSPTPSNGDLWWESDTFDLHVYYEDGSSNQWVSITSNAALKGEKGDTGTKGQKGEVGSQGSTGDKGQKGEIGATGGTGGTGLKGDKGQKGQDGTDASGAKGQKGEPSTVKGEKGQKGEVGAGGSDGSDGSDGDKGQKGEAGAAASKGQKGEVGAGGAGGDKGQKGEKGQIGADGGSGADGSDGDKGQKGEVGAGGSGGDKGQKGEVGATGSAASYTVKQVLSTSTTGTQYYRYYQGPIDTGLSLTINCADANNKILIEYTICCAATVGNSSFGGSRYVGSRLLRNNSQIASGSGGGSGNESVYTDTGSDSLDHHSFSYMDTPGAGNHTYKVQIRHHLSGSYSNYLVFNRSRDGNYRTMSTLTCSEIEI